MRPAPHSATRNFDLYYMAVEIDSGCDRFCWHMHLNIKEAARCGADNCGGYAVAVDHGRVRALTCAEQRAWRAALGGFRSVMKKLDRSA